MRKIFGSFLCCFVPSKNARQRIRERFCVDAGKTRNYGGKNNKIILVKNGVEKTVKKIPGCDIKFSGDNNIIKIYEPIRRLHLAAKMYGDSNITIMPSHFIDRRLKIRGMHYCNLFIDSDLSTNSECLLEFADKTDIHIGRDCMFADDVEIRTGDGHKIENAKTGKCINHSKNVYIGNHVWLGKNVMILKGCKISDNSVVGARSVVSGVFDKGGVVIAGVGAKVIKTGINWDRCASD